MKKQPTSDKSQLLRARLGVFISFDAPICHLGAFTGQVEMLVVAIILSGRVAEYEHIQGRLSNRSHLWFQGMLSPSNDEKIPYLTLVSNMVPYLVPDKIFFPI
jgi:hypothetical protein